MEENTWDANEEDASINILLERQTQEKWESPHGALYQLQQGLLCSFSHSLSQETDSAESCREVKHALTLFESFSFHFH